MNPFQTNVCLLIRQLSTEIFKKEVFDWLIGLGDIRRDRAQKMCENSGLVYSILTSDDFSGEEKDQFREIVNRYQSKDYLFDFFKDRITVGNE